jgi:hypothetical protein
MPNGVVPGGAGSSNPDLVSLLICALMLLIGPHDSFLNLSAYCNEALHKV